MRYLAAPADTPHAGHEPEPSGGGLFRIRRLAAEGAEGHMHRHCLPVLAAVAGGIRLYMDGDEKPGVHCAAVDNESDVAHLDAGDWAFDLRLKVFLGVFLDTRYAVALHGQFLTAGVELR